eukprot:747705-Hanusia_phi.AAC.7
MLSTLRSCALFTFPAQLSAPRGTISSPSPLSIPLFSPCSPPPSESSEDQAALPSPGPLPALQFSSYPLQFLALLLTCFATGTHMV